MDQIQEIPKKLKLTFCGGVGTVTGANFLLEEESTDTKILVDCGLEQGGEEAHAANRKPFIYDPSKIKVLMVTHAHVDHVGRIPKLVKDGFRGIIYSTPETMRLAPLMLEDSVKLLAHEAEHYQEEPLYTEEDVAKALSLWKSIPYHHHFEIASGFDVYLKDAGHVLGSSMIELTYNGKKIVFTGDLGNSPSPLLKDTEPITDADYLLMESVYGDRNHESRDERLNKFEDIIEDTIKKGGALVIPSFSLEKTQDVLLELNNLIESGRVPSVPVYVDSPLAIKITQVYKTMPEDFNDQVREEIRRGDDVFNFPKIHFTETSEESKAILNIPNPKIIIAGSGMSNGGRIQHHEVNYLSDPKSTLLLIGYQAAGTLGRVIQDGSKTVTILGQEIKIKANIEYISGYSSHKDSDHLFQFVEQTADAVKKVFVVMGEAKSSLFLVQRLRDYLGLEAFHPEEGESVLLDF
ncbi:MAG: MBL fold metallo-hydrolase [Candidatus Pacebacteria bacterium]|nr:MBL fold metallo-hydrolase [Candidatus Paceibacterota bacterium]